MTGPRIPDSFELGDRVIAVAGTPLRPTGQGGTVVGANLRHRGVKVEWDAQPYPFSPKVSRANASSLRREGWTSDEPPATRSENLTNRAGTV